MTSSARAKASTPGLPQGPALDSPLVPWRTSFRHGIIIIIFREFCAPPGVEVTPALLGWGSTDQPGTHQPQAMTARTGRAWVALVWTLPRSSASSRPHT